MVQSMTGYCNRESVWQLQSGEKYRLNVEVKSLNSRFFELNIKLPSALFSLENQLIALFKQKLVRGKVFLTVKILDENANFEEVSLNKNLINSYLKISKDLADLTSAKSDLKTFEWLSLPRVVSFETSRLAPADLESFLGLASNWASDLLSDRVSEGSFIVSDLENSLAKIQGLQKVVFAANKKILEQIRSELDEQKKIWGNSKGNPDHEVAHEHKKVAELEFSLERSDIHEEISRSEMHVESVKKLFASPGYEVGKKLEFTLQELLRETNTITSKSSNFEINSSCVDIKFELEKLREQSQNIV